jgi:hypothetical protein
MNREFSMKHLEPLEQAYHLVVKPLKVSQTYEDEQSQGKLGLITRDVILFQLSESSEVYRFLSAWLGVPGKLVEVLIRINHPFHQYARAALMHPKSQDPQSLFDEIHLYLMSYGLTQILLSKPSLLGKPLEIVALPASDDHPDGAPTDGVGEGDDLYAGTRREVKTGFETPGEQLSAPVDAPDRHGRVFPPIKTV